MYYVAEGGISAYLGSNNWTVSNDTVQGSGLGYATQPDNMYLYAVGGTGFNVFGNTVFDGYGTGIRLAASGNIYNNVIYGNWYGIETAGDITGNMNIYGNTIYDNDGFYGIEVNGARNCSIYRNLIYNNDDVGIGVLAGTAHNIYYNIIYGHIVSGIGFEVSAGDSSTVYNNVSYNNVNGIQNDSTDVLTIKNNILMNNTSYGYVTGGTETFTNNDVWNNTTGDYSGIADQTGSNGNISADPLFTTAGSDFTLTSTSPAIDAGVSVGLVLDYAGNTVPFNTLPDIGAYELQTSAGYEVRFPRFKDFTKFPRR